MPRKINISNLKCPECGKYIPIPRPNRTREKNHKKNMYCPFCNKVQTMKEIRSCDYDEEETRFMKTDIKIFLSHNMSSIDEELVLKKREEAKEFLTNKLSKDFNVSFIENYYHEDAPENADRLWHLGKSIQQLQEADYIYFIPNFDSSNGCTVERVIASLYNIPKLGDIIP